MVQQRCSKHPLAIPQGSQPDALQVTAAQYQFKSHAYRDGGKTGQPFPAGMAPDFKGRKKGTVVKKNVNGNLEFGPCALCGGKGELSPMPSAPTWWRVRCADFKCGCTTWAMQSPEMAVEAWNRRPDAKA
jgi:hypothetical protein